MQLNSTILHEFGLNNQGTVESIQKDFLRRLSKIEFQAI